MTTKKEAKVMKKMKKNLFVQKLQALKIICVESILEIITTTTKVLMKIKVLIKAKLNVQIDEISNKQSKKVYNNQNTRINSDKN